VAHEADPDRLHRAEPVGEDQGLKKLRRDVNRFLRVRERTAAEIRLYLRRRGHPIDLAVQALNELLESGLVDDGRFARLFLLDRARLRPRGFRILEQELLAKGVSPAIARESLAELADEIPEKELARRRLASRWQRWRPEERSKRGQADLLRCGFPAGIVEEVIAEITTSAEGETQPEQTGRL
jgi:regulatory protein